METHSFRWPGRPGFVRLRIVEDGIRRDVRIERVLPQEPGVPARIDVRHVGPGPHVPPTVQLVESTDGVNWAVVQD